MAQITNTHETYPGTGSAKGNKEEVSSVIHMTTPEETPFLSLIGRKPCNSVKPEWLNDDIDAIDLSNNDPEGDDWSFDAITPPNRVNQYTQISSKKLIVSRTQDSVDKYGRNTDTAYELSKKGVALRCDMEAITLQNQASSAGSADGATNRTLAGFRPWLTSNDSFGSGGGTTGFSGGTVAVATNGTQRAFTKTLLDDVILSTYNSGGNPKVLMVSPYVKQVFSRMLDGSDVVALRNAVSEKKKRTIIGTAEVYLSDFGSLDVVPNRQMARAGAAVARNAYVIDPSAIRLGVLDDIQVKTPAITGDATKKVLVCEYTLVVNTEKAHGVIADLYGMSAST